MKFCVQSICFHISLFLFCSPSLRAYAEQTSRIKNGVKTQGDIIIGGLIPVHFSPNFAPHPGNSLCNGSFHLRGYKGVEAMLYAVKRINDNPNLLPGLKLGVDIKDTCGSVNYAIMESLNFNFIRNKLTALEQKECNKNLRNVHERTTFAPSGDGKSFNTDSTSRLTSNSKGSTQQNLSDCCSLANNSAAPTAAIIGAAFSGVTMAVASLTGLFHVPVISYASTSRLLSDRSRFQYFYRTVPSDDLQAHAITDLLYELKWHFVILLASDNEYGRSGITAIKQAIYNHTSRRVCVVVEEVFSRKGTKNEMENIFRKIKKANDARVIILYVEYPDAVFFFKEAKKECLQDYLFVASDSWVGSSEVIEDAGNVFRSIIGFRPPVFPMPKFDTFFTDRINGSSENPWTSDLSKSSICSGNKTQQCYNEVHHNGYVPYVIDAVFSVAHALHAMLNCNRRACAKTLGNVEQRYLSQFIQNVSFEGCSQKNFFFNEKGTTRGKYEVYIVRNGSSTYRRIGIWDGSFSLRLNLSKASKYGTSVKLPTSVCSEDCRKGEYRIPRPLFPECCWDCAKCTGKSFTNTSHKRNCTECPLGHWPNHDHSDCRLIEASHLLWNEGWVLLIVSLCSFGAILAVLTCAIFIKYRETAVVRASSEQLCHVLLLGIAMSYVTPIGFVVKPSKISCNLLPFMFGICFVMVVGTILIKTNRISRIFNEKLLRTGSVSCLSNYWQLLILGCLLVTEIILSVGWVFGSPGRVFQDIIYSESDAWLVCNLVGNQIGFSLWLIYNAGLVIVCTYQAFLVRKVPQNYNESRLIAFNMTTLCITVLVFVPSYMGTTAWYRSIISSLMLVFLGSLTWACIFAPKIYIILLRPHKNVPMRPSVTSLTLGVITPRQTVIRNFSEQATCSPKNSLPGNQEGSVVDDLHRSRGDTVVSDLLVDSRETGVDCFATQDTGTQTGEEIHNTNINEVNNHERAENGPEKEKPVPEKINSLEDQMNPRKKSNSSNCQSGILRKTVENYNGLSLKRKKTSLVRFQDEETNSECGGKKSFKISDSVELEESQTDLTTHLTSEDNCNHDGAVMNGFPHASDYENNNRLRNTVGEDRKRKLSVFSFEAF